MSVGAGVEHPGDAGVVHQREGLALGLEAGHDLLGVHARLDDLQGDARRRARVCSARYTTPMPPLPRTWRIS